MERRGRLLTKGTTENVPSDDWANYNYPRRITKVMDNIKKNHSTANFQVILDYVNYMTRKPKALATQSKTVQTLYTMTAYLKNEVTPRGVEKDWGVRDVNSRSKWSAMIKQEEVNQLIEFVMLNYSDGGKESNSSADMKKLTRLFLRWLVTGNSDLPKNQPEAELILGITIGSVEDKIALEDIPTDKDIEKMIKASHNVPRNIALIRCHSEAGTRESELLSMRVRDFIPQKEGAIIRVDGKTGARKIQLVRSVPAMMQYFNTHPFRDNLDAPFWLMSTSNTFGKAMTYDAMRGIFKRTMVRAGIKNNYKLHSFRHYAATNASKFFTDTEMRKRFGWGKESPQPSRYSHLMMTDVNEKYLREMGVELPDENKPRPPIECQYCKTINEPDMDQCVQCNQPLTVEGQNNMERGRDEQMAKMSSQLEAVMEHLKIKKLDDTVSDVYQKQHRMEEDENE